MLPDGCLAGLPLDGGAGPRLTRLATRCMQGMCPLLAKPRKLRLPQNGQGTVPFELADSTRCVRIAAAGGPEVHELELTLMGRHGSSPLGTDRLPGPWALVGAQGPICLQAPGTYRARVALVRGQGRVTLQIWVAC